MKTEQDDILFHLIKTKSIYLAVTDSWRYVCQVCNLHLLLHSFQQVKLLKYLSEKRKERYKNIKKIHTFTLVALLNKYHAWAFWNTWKWNCKYPGN